MLLNQYFERKNFFWSCVGLQALVQDGQVFMRRMFAIFMANLGQIAPIRLLLHNPAPVNGGPRIVFVKKNAHTLPELRSLYPHCWCDRRRIMLQPCEDLSKRPTPSNCARVRGYNSRNVGCQRSQASRKQFCAAFFGLACLAQST